MRVQMRCLCGRSIGVDFSLRVKESSRTLIHKDRRDVTNVTSLRSLFVPGYLIDSCLFWARFALRDYKEDVQIKEQPLVTHALLLWPVLR
jgi:hypothetical protein